MSCQRRLASILVAKVDPSLRWDDDDASAFSRTGRRSFPPGFPGDAQVMTAPQSSAAHGVSGDLLRTAWWWRVQTSAAVEEAPPPLRGPPPLESEGRKLLS